MEKTAKTMALYPKVQELSENRSYPEEDVKKILYGFGRDIEKKRGLKPWRAEKLRKEVESVFNFD